MKRYTLVMALCLMSTAAFAADSWWTNTASSGDFNLAANWSGATMVPTTNRIAWFYTPNWGVERTLNVSANASFEGWSQDYWPTVVNLNTAGFTLDSGTNTSYGVSEYGAYTVTNRIYGGGTLKISAGGFRIGTRMADATSPLVEVSNTTVQVAGSIIVGNNARLKIYSGATVRQTNQYLTSFLGQYGGTAAGIKEANIEVSDVGTTLSIAGARFVIGNRRDGSNIGNGTLTIKSGAKAYFDGVQLSGNSYEGTTWNVTNFATKGTVNVQDVGSLFHATNDVYVGLANTGVVTVANGGRLRSGRLYLGPGMVGGEMWGNIVGTNKNAYGVLTVTGDGSTASVERLTIGYAGTGLIEALNKGRIETRTTGIYMTNGTMKVDDAFVGSQTVLSTGGNNAFEFVLRTKAETEYYLDVATVLTLNGTDNISVNLSNFSGAYGQYRLINYGTLSGTFDNVAFGNIIETGNANYVGTTLENNNSDGYVYLNVIPEPASILLLASGIVAAYKLRRRA